jgi:hypothetical protein
MLEKLIILCADEQYANELLESTERLEERVGSNSDTKELKKLLTNTLKLCQLIYVSMVIFIK